MLEPHRPAPPEHTLMLLPAYLGTDSIAEAIQTARGRRMLWLEILVNDQLDLGPCISDPAVQAAYSTACRWYTQYRRLITYLLGRAPLPSDTGPIDFRDYRAFAEVLSFVCAHR
jgi:hypothetical protein